MLFAALLLQSAVAQSLPPLVTTTATTTLDSAGRPWAYLAFGENRPGLIASHRLAVYSRPGTEDVTANFTLRGPVGPVMDPTAIQVLLGRAASVGDNLPALEAQLIALHRSLLNGADPPSLPLAQRLAALLNRAAGDAALGQLLDLYGLAHPGLRLVRGTAWAGPLTVAVGSPVTLEVRERNAAGADAGVIGRVTLLAGQAENLPAPGPTVVVPDVAATGDLNVKLRWATPEALRHVGTRHHGDLVWRVSRAFAEAQGLNLNAPAGAALDALTISNPADVRRLAGPVFPSKLFSVTNVADFAADATTTFASDNNDRYATSGAALPEGAQFYYFVAAADALGRPGLASAGVLGTFCSRVPPPVPARLAVANRWTGLNGRSLDVSWTANADGLRTDRYELYRGDDLTLLAAAQRGQLDLGTVPIVPGRPDAIKLVGVFDQSANGAAPTLHASDLGNNAYGKTWWFAVRAVHLSVSDCGNLFSPLTPPAFGALRDQSSPVAADPTQIVPPVGECLRVACLRDVVAQDEISPTALDTNSLQFIARCDRRPGITAAHFQVLDTVDNSVVVPETAVVFAEGESTVELTWTRPLALLSHPLNVQCEADAFGQGTSVWAQSVGSPVAPDGNHRSAHHFIAGAIAKSELAAAAATDPLWAAALFQPFGLCPSDVHLVVSPATGTIFQPVLCVPITPGTAQYRVYRRVADGPLTLIGQGLQTYTGPGCTVTNRDGAPPVSNGLVQYFAQLLDEQGRPSAMRKLGALRFTGDKPPTPVLLTPQGADYGGTAAAPTVSLTWICAPEHVERFEVLFLTAKPPGAPDQGVLSPLGAPSVLTPKALVPTVYKVSSKLAAADQNVLHIQQSFLSGRVGGDFGPGPRFTMPLQVDPHLQYTVWLRALGPNGEPSEPSRSITFQWQPPSPPVASIAWPARPLPPVAPFNSGIGVVDFGNFAASRLIWGSLTNNGTFTPLEPSVSTNATPVGIRVGSLVIDNDQARRGFGSAPSFGAILYTPTTSLTYGKADPNQQLFTRDGDATQKLLPCVLYRQQLPNDVFPQVSGDVIQCSPLIRSIAWVAGQPNGKIIYAELADPFFRWVGPDLTTPNLDLFLVDTQPVVGSARYRYWLVRFSNLGEPIQTVPCGEVTVNSP